MKDGWVRESSLNAFRPGRNLRELLPILTKSPYNSVDIREAKAPDDDSGGGGNGGIVTFVARGSGTELGKAVSATGENATVEICCNDSEGS